MRVRLLVLVALAVVMLAMVVIEPIRSSMAMLVDEARTKALVTSFGIFGPLVLIALMIVAVVASPIPSGPLALAAGALYGPLWGTLIVVVGAEAGAILAFSLSRYLALDWVRQSSNGIARWIVKPRTPTVLMGIVFASRLIPFISFDAVSYAAGLTTLSLWRFALATALGVVPVSFGLTYLGDRMVDAPPTLVALILVALCLLTAVPFAVRRLMTRRRDAKETRQQKGPAEAGP